ncbi:hypothetical protein VP1G_09137 [Cytospora mali]|uniref:DUF7924 domain-containing protein n=1 Tax=Cytospora mali TaxID=578113 RepID=A0A194VDC2_CYTMA|nr:hypothetical protein VP1G_09137 [Valsa mali var. pyri (nom. inval.)]
MARQQSRKRPRGDDPSQGHLPPKEAMLNDKIPKASTFAPEFYNDLSKRSQLWLTPRALRELDRRNDQTRLSKPTTPNTSFTSLAEFARQNRRGGPDLRDLRGAMAFTPSASSKRVDPKIKRSSAYDANFEQHLINNNIYSPLYRLPNCQKHPKPANWEEIRQVLMVSRGSLSPSVIPESAFEDFQLKNNTKSEGTLMRSVVPILAGDVDIFNEGHLPFINLDSLTKDTTVCPVPDFFDGAHPAAVDMQVREDLDKTIIPTKHASVPIVPNLFLEAKSLEGNCDVARRQAVLNGAHGARIMNALQNYLKEEPEYDGNSYAFTATLLDGQLRLYAHHLAAPDSPGQVPHYHTTQLKAYALTGDSDYWLEGTGAFRNLRVLAKDYRDRFIEIANARARNRGPETADTYGNDLVSTVESQDV